MLNQRRALLVLAPIVLALGCLALPRYKSVAPRSGPEPRESLARDLDPWLLADGLTRKIVVEVDWVQGCEPGPKTLEGLRRILLKYGPPGLEVEIVRDDQISLEEWQQGAGDDEQRVNRLIDQHAEFTNEPGIETRYVLFAPRSQDGYFGFSYREVFERPDHPKEVSGVVVFRGSHARYAKLWISLDKLERMTLVHEFGHQLGLVSDPRHERIDRPHRGHCTRLDCSMAHPTPRVIVRNFIPGVFGRFFRDYCPECQAEIRTAQAVWREQQQRDPDWNSKQAESRAARTRISQLWNRFLAKDYESVLAGVEAERAHGYDQERLGWLRFNALMNLGRVDQIVESWQREGELFAKDYQLGLVLIGAGRQNQVLELFSGEGRRGDTAFYLQERAHLGLGDAAAAARARAQQSYKPEHQSASRAELADLLRRSGDLPAAEQVLTPLLRSRPSAQVLLVAASVREGQGQADEAKRLKEKCLRMARRGGQSEVHVYAKALMSLGRAQEAVDVLAKQQPWTSQSLLLALAALDRIEEIGQRIRELSVYDRGRIDPCALDELVPLRTDPRLGGALDYCPSRREKTEAAR